MSDSLFTLPVKQTLSPSLTLRQQDELPLVVVEHPQVRAAVTLQGAHLVAWQPAGEKPVLWLSEKSAFQEGVAIRGGVPICWPWFGKVATPNHGFARILPWELSDHSEDDKQVQLTFTLRDSTLTEPFFPHPFTLKAHFTLGQTCSIELVAEGEYQTTSALHSYFTVGAIGDIHVSGLGDSFIDKVNGGKAEQQQGDVTFAGEVDRVYTAPEPTSLIHDPVLGRVIEVHHQHHSDVVAWNCGQSLSHSIGDFADDSYLSYVCVETARVNDPLVSTAAAPARLRQTLRLRKS
ncbi:Aldose 1-epimerase [Sodalis praecaptivus]|uniref:Putative glucose-6-phosphate 1-epimerase n=1 Tax=Sodalis praecaptivus TaxID=1239307 RepID=W0HWG5_9GAMM|nr:D-hexose-6-phosphate mutarotase [Sodalis praecaptivus]AHF76867.1 Aldose 1-epimerase [Sodalis praecaptivus]